MKHTQAERIVVRISMREGPGACSFSRNTYLMERGTQGQGNNKGDPLSQGAAESQRVTTLHFVKLPFVPQL